MFIKLISTNWHNHFRTNLSQFIMIELIYIPLFNLSFNFHGNISYKFLSN